MVIVIDATNIRGGGGVTHLVELLRETEPSSFGITKIVVCATLNTIEKNLFTICYKINLPFEYNDGR